MINSVTVEGYVASTPVLTTTRSGHRYYNLTIENVVKWKEQEYRTNVPISVWKEELHELCDKLKAGEHITISGKIKTSLAKNKEGREFINIVVRDIYHGERQENSFEEKSRRKSERNAQYWSQKGFEEGRQDASNEVNAVRNANDSIKETVKKAEELLNVPF